MSTNPVTFLLGAAGVGLREFGRDERFAEKTVSDVVAGVYPAIPPRFTKAVEDLCDRKGFEYTDLLSEEYGTDNIDSAYTYWQQAERQKNAPYFTGSDIPIGGSDQFSPAYYFTRDTCGTPYQFCKLLLVPPASVLRWVAGTTRQMPKAIAEALQEIGFERIQELQDKQEAWLDAHPTRLDS